MIPCSRARNQNGLARFPVIYWSVFEGDTIYAQTEVLSVRDSKSRPNMGIVEVKTTGFKQDGTVVMTFRRSILVYRRGHVPSVPLPQIK